MQEQGKGGDVQSPANPKPEDKKEAEKPQASREYVEYAHCPSRLYTSQHKSCLTPIQDSCAGCKQT
jgi:hypothetical protein